MHVTGVLKEEGRKTLVPGLLFLVIKPETRDLKLETFSSPVNFYLSTSKDRKSLFVRQ